MKCRSAWPRWRKKWRLSRARAVMLRSSGLGTSGGPGLAALGRAAPIMLVLEDADYTARGSLGGGDLRELRRHGVLEQRFWRCFGRWRAGHRRRVDFRRRAASRRRREQFGRHREHRRRGSHPIGRRAEYGWRAERRLAWHRGQACALRRQPQCRRYAHRRHEHGRCRGGPSGRCSKRGRQGHRRDQHRRHEHRLWWQRHRWRRWLGRLPRVHHGPGLHDFLGLLQLQAGARQRHHRLLRPGVHGGHLHLARDRTE
jgi:hypothetical protein